MNEQQKAYERFKLQWMLDHGYTLDDLIKELEEFREDCECASLTDVFDCWQFNCGFGSEIWPCYDEWAECEGADC